MRTKESMGNEEIFNETETIKKLKAAVTPDNAIRINNGEKKLEKSTKKKK